VTDDQPQWAALPREKTTIARRLWYLLQCALHLVAGATAGVRDSCKLLYASYPDEAVEEEFAASLAALGRDEE